MYKLTDNMLQNLEKDLKRFHELFQGGRCQAWQLEELLAKAIRSDFSKSEKVVWKGNGHDKESDIVVNDTHHIQVKSGQVKKGSLILSGHRLGRFKGDLEGMTEFLNSVASASMLIAVPYQVEEDSHGTKHTYQLFYINSEVLKLASYKKWEKKKSYFEAVNDKGVYLSIRPSMSWQVWWSIPLEILGKDAQTRVITIA